MSSTPPANRPILLLFGFGLFWLVVGGLLTLIHALQLDAPSFLACCPELTFGRSQALQESAFVYGWLGNAGAAVALWILVRLGGEPLRAGNWVTTGTLFWNLGLLAGLVGIAFGEGTSHVLLQMPRFVQPLMLIAYAAVAVGGILAWTGRRREDMHAAQWYAVAPLFLFPWLFSAAQALLLWSPLRGTLQAVVQGWYAQGLWTLWVAPITLAAAYYLLPRIKGGVLPAYDLARLGFWCLMFVGAWTGGRHLIGGPVPAWISSVAVVTSFVLLSHYFVVALNLRGLAAGGGLTVKFIRFGVGAYLLTGLFDAITAIRGVAEVTQFTFFDEALRQLAYYGAASMVLYGALYFAVPALTGRPWASAGLARVHLFLSVVGVIVLVVSLAVAGIAQGTSLNDPKTSFEAIAASTHVWLILASLGQAALLLGNLLLAVNFLKSAACPTYAAEGALAS